ncbi:glutathione S-transferase family protein [Spongiibacter sp. KMU-166]|uniref:Glutathione S-transferase family protein n=1 Tax=Spongiibacter thalassae TaxID=2721624 RepID=A0ABX1GCJ9_9GAMM|nr:glutathione S-transferase family protein [Spongiibacter thalassae]NKI16681.1 glutathione S-transferase family protein [Spongiibacter thalassae]
MTIKPKLWHCYSSRSLRPLWALAEMRLDYDLELLPFPPRMFQPDYLDINPLGTVPFFTDGPVEMTESTGICLYLVEKYGGDLGVPSSHPDYPDYLNWLFHSDATLTFPQTLVLRYSQLEPEERRSVAIVEDYRRWFLARLKRLDQHLLSREYLCAQRFTIADISVAYALYLATGLGLDQFFTPQTKAYAERMCSRPAFLQVEPLGAEQSLFTPQPYPFGMDFDSLPGAKK